MDSKFEKKGEPLGVKASRKSDNPLVYNEVHEYGKGNFYEDGVEEAREEILKYFGIPPEKAIVYPEIKEKKRKIRIFMILENKESGEKYYADGHIPHAEVLNFILKNFPQIGIESRQKIPSDFFDKWKTIKGFIDPYMNGFRNFPKLRSYLIREMEIEGQNGLAKDEVQFLKENPENNDIELPNWILST